jgi:hypothetical protein
LSPPVPLGWDEAILSHLKTSKKSFRKPLNTSSLGFPSRTFRGQDAGQDQPVLLSDKGHLSVFLALDVGYMQRKLIWEH